MFATLYLMIWAFIRHKILHIDDRSQLEIAISKVIGSYDDYMAKRKQQMASSPCYDYSYTIGRGVTEDKKKEMIDAIKNCGVGFVE